MDKKLDSQVKQRLLQTRCLDSYETVLESVVEEFFRELTRQHATAIQQFMHRLDTVQLHNKGQR